MRYLLFLFVFISSTTLAQNGINYQGAATDSEGAKLVDQNISLRTSILQGGVDGNTSYSETHNTTTDQFGLFNVVIGQGEVVSGDFEGISWGADAHFLKVELDATGGLDYSLVSTTQMMSVPYALYAENAGLDSAAVADMIINPGVGSANNFQLECVDMGVSVMCSGLGIDPSTPLSSPNNFNYDMSGDVYLNVNNYITLPNWRKFKVVGLDGLMPTGGKLMFKHKYQSIDASNNSSIQYPIFHFLTPEIINGSVYFYMYEIRYNANNNCASESDILLSIPADHSWKVSFDASTHYYRNAFEIYYETSNGFKPTGIIFDR